MKTDTILDMFFLGELNHTKYKTVPTIHRPDLFLPEEFMMQQGRDLADALLIGPMDDPSFVADEGEISCHICLTNSATRMAIPCAYYIVCLPEFISQQRFYLVTGRGG
jgi:hypothetical protein